MGCSAGTVFGPSKGQVGTSYIRLDCQKLSCPKCGHRRAKKYRLAVTKIAEKLKLRRFLTLTLDPSLIPEGVDSVQHLRSCWAKLRVYIGREFPKTSYISVVELHPKSGRAHLHVLVSRYISQKWIKKCWQAVGAGRIVDIRMVDMHRIGAYLSKYITKELLLLVPWRKKRISTSRDIRLFEKKQKSEFCFLREHIDTVWDRLCDNLMGGKVGNHEYDEDGLRGFLYMEYGVT